MIIFWLAILGSILVTAFMGAARLFLGRRRGVAREGLLAWLGIIFGVNFVLDLLILYFAQPALTGPYGGWQWLLWPLLLSGIVSIFLNSVVSGQRFVDSVISAARSGRFRIVDQRDPKLSEQVASGAGPAALLAIALALVVGIVCNSIIAISTTWFDPNAKALAHIPNVTVMPSSATLPPTNVNHIVLVSQDIAAYRGQQVLAQNGQNLGSIYQTVQSEYALQAVAGHLYWIAPLVYNNVFANLQHDSTPGFVVVDAEDPNAQPQLRTGYHLHYVPGALFNQDLIRHVYLSGYTYGNLVDPTLEVDDSWHPYFTISLMQPSRGFTGDVLYQVLLVDPQSGAIHVYAPKDVPSWVDRVMPASTVTQYLGWWGQYHAAPWFNPSGAGQQQPAGDPELVYNTVDKPVWLVPMTSSSSNDNSSTGIMLFDTHQNSAQFYPLAGIGVGSNVNNTFESNPHNIRQYQVSSVQLYDIYGVPTWVAIFSQPVSQGATFQAVGIVDAAELNPSNVQMEPTRDQALADYSQWLASQNKTAGSGPSSLGNQSTMSGKVIRVAPVAVNGSTIYYLWIQGQAHIFTAPLSLSPELPLVQPGDMISGTYLETGTQVVTLTSFSDSSITIQPTPQPSPGT
jgi:hypothetical protein